MSRWESAGTYLPGRRGLTALTLLALLLVAAALRPGPYFSSGNLHDVFMPYAAVLSALQGQQLHVDFHTPFGWVYTTLNVAAWQVIGALPGLFTINDLVVISSLLAGSVVVCLHLVTVVASPRAQRPSTGVLWLVGLFLFVLALNIRGHSSIQIADVTWYGTYNSHLWALTLLQLFWAFALSASRSVAAWQIACQAIVQGLAVALVCNYKVSMAPAAMAFALLPLLTMQQSRAERSLYLGVASLACAGTFWLGAPENHSYQSYLQDLLIAATAKRQMNKDLDASLLFGTAVLASILTVQFCLSRAWAHLGWVRSAIVATGVSLGTYLGILGDFSHSPYYFAAVWALITLTHPEGLSDTRAWVSKLPAVVLLLGYATVVSQWGLLAKHKITKIDLSRVSQVTVPTAYGQLNWVIPLKLPSGYGLLAERFELATHPRQLDIKLRLGFPSDSKINKRLLPFTQADYADTLMSLARQARQQPDKRHLYLEFVDAYPLLTGRPVPQGTFHWLHFGTSIPFTGAEAVLSKLLGSADVISVPIVNVDYEGQTLLNCKFYLWNQAQGLPWKLAATDNFTLHFDRTPGITDLMSAADHADVSQRCRQLTASQLAQKRLTQLP